MQTEVQEAKSWTEQQLIQLSISRDYSRDGQGCGCAVCFARNDHSERPRHFEWCWVGMALEQLAGDLGNGKS